MFDPFARDNSAAQIEGTGLGLSIARGLVELMDGRIAVESKLKEGSVFRVELEFDKAQESSAARTELNGMLPAAQLHRKLLEGRRFLVAEDNQINAEIIRELLAVYGAGCEVEPDGAQAVRAFLEKEPGTYDAILMDIQMPVMKGYEAAGAIRALSRPDHSHNGQRFFRGRAEGPGGRDEYPCGKAHRYEPAGRRAAYGAG